MAEQYSKEQIRRFANMVAGRALDDVLNVAAEESFLKERFPDDELREAVLDEVARIARRLRKNGEHSPGGSGGRRV